MALQLTSRARCGVRAMFQLACHWGDGPVPLRAIADEQDLSLAFLEQIVRDLRLAGLVESSRGCQGGYCLSREPAAITVGDVIRCLEGPIFLAACADPDPDFEECVRGSFCVSRLLWTKVSQQIKEAFDSVSLEDLRAASQRQPDEARKVFSIR
ncbi:MAG TPA: Rrf2 family transcriptional regulator [Acidobacteriota bacterium]